MSDKYVKRKVSIDVKKKNISTSTQRGDRSRNNLILDQTMEKEKALMDFLFKNSKNNIKITEPKFVTQRTKLTTLKNIPVDKTPTLKEIFPSKTKFLHYDKSKNLISPKTSKKQFSSNKLQKNSKGPLGNVFNSFCPTKNTEENYNANKCLTEEEVASYSVTNRNTNINNINKNFTYWSNIANLSNLENINSKINITNISNNSPSFTKISNAKNSSFKNLNKTNELDFYKTYNSLKNIQVANNSSTHTNSSSSNNQGSQNNTDKNNKFKQWIGKEVNTKVVESSCIINFSRNKKEYEKMLRIFDIYISKQLNYINFNDEEENTLIDLGVKHYAMFLNHIKDAAFVSAQCAKKFLRQNKKVLVIFPIESDEALFEKEFYKISGKELSSENLAKVKEEMEGLLTIKNLNSIKKLFQEDSLNSNKHKIYDVVIECPYQNIEHFREIKRKFLKASLWDDKYIISCLKPSDGEEIQNLRQFEIEKFKIINLLSCSFLINDRNKDIKENSLPASTFSEQMQKI